MAYKGELEPPIHVEPGQAVEFILNTTPHAGYNALSSTNRSYVKTVDGGTVGGEAAVIPAGTEFVANGSGDYKTWTGTVAEGADPYTEYFLTPTQIVRGAVGDWWRIRLVLPEPDVEIPAPEGPIWEPFNYIYELPDALNVSWSRDGAATAPGIYRAESGETVTVTATADDGYIFPAGQKTADYTLTFPVDEPGPPAGITPGGEMVARWLQWEDEEDKETASFHYWAVSSFVNGYTRGRGFNDDEPKRDVQVVIVSAAARLARNPENLTRLQVDNVTESRTVFEGFNIAELGVLNRYRRRQA